MSTSGTYSFNLNLQQILEGALRLVGAVETGQPYYPQNLTDAQQALNIYIKALQAEGIGLWCLADLTVFLDTVSESYLIGPTSSNFVTTDSVIQLSLAFSAAQGANSIMLGSITGLTAGANIGIQLDNNTTQWTTISGTPTGSTVNLAAALSYSASQNNNIFSYVNTAQRPLDIANEGRRRDVFGNDTPLTILNREDYNQLSVKSNIGSTTQIYYSPTLNNGTLYIWPVASVCTDRAVLTARIPFQDFDNMPDNADFPVEWLRHLKWALAAEIGPEYEVNPNKQKQLETKAAETKALVAPHDMEVSYSFVPDMTVRR